MSTYRFHLKKYVTGSKIRCPKCGKKACFTRYIDEDGIIDFPDYVGRCDHESSCGYHFAPAQYFESNPQCYSPSFHTAPRVVVPKPPSFIDTSVMLSTIKHYDRNNLFVYLSRRFGAEKIEPIFKEYNVGTANKWGGSTVYWQVDAAQRVHAGKIMAYDDTGHRIKNVPAVTWVHSELHLPDFNLRQCFFGEHLLPKYPDKTVAIVESEKTALICAFFMPEMLWIASGGCSGCMNREAAKALAGRTVVLVPDLGMLEKWQEKSAVFDGICRSVTVSNHIDMLATDQQREEGYDIADYFLQLADKPNKQRRRSAEDWTDDEVLEYILERNPAVRKLVDDLDLSILR